jgi:hypothetical protein
MSVVVAEPAPRVTPELVTVDALATLGHKVIRAFATHSPLDDDHDAATASSLAALITAFDALTEAALAAPTPVFDDWFSQRGPYGILAASRSASYWGGRYSGAHDGFHYLATYLYEILLRRANAEQRRDMATDLFFGAVNFNEAEVDGLLTLVLRNEPDHANRLNAYLLATQRMSAAPYFRALRDRSWVVRDWVVKDTSVGTADVVNRALSDSSARVRLTAAQRLVRDGAMTAEICAALTSDQSPKVRQVAATQWLDLLGDTDPFS